LKKKKRGPGRPSFHTKHPEIISCVRSFIEESSSESHLCRRTSVMYTNVLLQDIVNHVKKTLGITATRNTIHRLMKPLRKNTTSGRLFKSLVNARIPSKRNTKEKVTIPLYFSIRVPRSTYYLYDEHIFAYQKFLVFWTTLVVYHLICKNANIKENSCCAKFITFCCAKFNHPFSFINTPPV